MQDCAERVRRCTERKLILARESEYCSRSRFDQGRSVETCLSIRKTMIGLDRTELMRTDTAERAVLRNNEERDWRITNACVTRHSIEIHCRGISSNVSPFKLYCEIGRYDLQASTFFYDITTQLCYIINRLRNSQLWSIFSLKKKTNSCYFVE